MIVTFSTREISRTKRSHTQKEQITRKNQTAEINKIENKIRKKSMKQRIGSLRKSKRLINPCPNYLKGRKRIFKLTKLGNPKN